MTLNACAAIVERSDPDRFLATMSCPPVVREKLFPLFAYNAEIARAPWVTGEPIIAQMRLQWWRDAVDEAGMGKPARAHEVAAPLHGLIQQHTGLPPLLDAMAEARLWEVQPAPFADAAALWAHIDAGSGNLGWACALCFAVPPEREPVVRAAALASGLAAWLMAVPALRAKGMEPLPPSVSADKLAQDGLARLREAKRENTRDITPVLRPFWRAEALLKQVVKTPEAVENGALGTSEFRRRASLIYKSMRGSW
ncbi:MAG: squalene/phytoene synthase family protein [Rhodobacteraceae bacterium]|nr:squalene/phytoene synthase family protein [Paracoccaceae bacterium]